MRQINVNTQTGETTFEEVPDIEMVIITPMPTLEDCIQEVKYLVEGLSTDFMGYMDWYFTTHPEEA